MIKKCETCEGIFKTTARNAKFCSIECSSIWKSKHMSGENSPQWEGGKIKRKCLICEKDTYRSKSAIEKGHGQFCSRKCQNIWVTKNLSGKNSPMWTSEKVECGICGNSLYKKRNIIKRGWGKFCSRKCAGTWKAQTSKGKNNANWNGGKIQCICQTCSKKFYVFPRTLKNNRGGKFCSRSCCSIATALKGKNRDTSIEIAIENELIRRNIIFKKQYTIPQARTIPDFFIEPNIAIFADGDYWHNIPKTIELNKNQNFWLEFLGYKVYRFWEHDIKKSVKKCINKIKEIKIAYTDILGLKDTFI